MQVASREAATAASAAEPQRFPFGVDFQGSLLRLLLEDTGLAVAIGKYVQPQFFENEAMAWAWSYCQRHEEQYGGVPSIAVLLHKANQADPKVRSVYVATLETVRAADVRDAEWLKDNVLDFIKRNLFVRAYHESGSLYNAGKISQAYDLMMAQMEELHRTTWSLDDRSFFFDDLGRRMMERHQVDWSTQKIPTGFPWLDHILEGGLGKSELGIWVAYPKIGKTSFLVNLGRAGTAVAWRRTAHFVFEGSRRQVENRYDAAFMEEFYAKVKRGDVDAERYQRALRAYQQMKGLLVVQGFTEEWDYSVVDIHNALKSLKRGFNWEPDLLIVDYGDLLRGPEKHYKSDYERQKAAFRGLKSLANRDYAVWTASQAERPKEKSEDVEHLLRARQIADCYEKVRVADFLGSLNQTNAEKRGNVMRLYAEMYRDNAADQSQVVQADLSRMLIYHNQNLATEWEKVRQEQQQQQQQAPQSRAPQQMAAFS